MHVNALIDDLQPYRKRSIRQRVVKKTEETLINQTAAQLQRESLRVEQHYPPLFFQPHVENHIWVPCYGGDDIMLDVVSGKTEHQTQYEPSVLDCFEMDASGC